ncbi:hypothetical protein M422DRAFT_253027 [Sphaerobolus stellatus SS14]|uniref:Uncharacterized protein n=1 Tax=Sphaerobolus stellatus (strain SS14) TaxID=990650 RepID=A0A0C9VXV2_SPHS4|nr:hypothetical protein M422DRAFT_253027 [Sphaerobolus stellatus SS14]
MHRREKLRLRASLPAQVDVLITGAESAGLATAIAVVKLAIVDSAAINRNSSRVSILYPRTLEVLWLVLDTIDLADLIVEEGTPSQGQRSFGARTELLTINLDLIKHSTKFSCLVHSAGGK